MRLHEIIGTIDSSPEGNHQRVRVHNSIRPLKSFSRSEVYQQHNGRKPNGLWWSFDQDWHSFVNERKPKGKRVGKFDYQVELDPHTCKLVQLFTFDDILAFTVEFGTTPAPGGQFFWQRGDRSRYDPAQDDQLRDRNRCRVGQIAWEQVARAYDGIEFPSYGSQSDGRANFEWLDIDWDVASGCAWNLAGFKLFRLPASYDRLDRGV